MSDTVAIDALPYYDRGYDEPGVREAAMQLVQEEMQRYRPTKDYLENLPSVGKSKLNKIRRRNNVWRSNIRLVSIIWRITLVILIRY